MMKKISMISISDQQNLNINIMFPLYLIKVAKDPKVLPKERNLLVKLKETQVKIINRIANTNHK